MSDFIDLLRVARFEPDYLKDPVKLRAFTLSSAELDVLKKLDAETIKVVLDALEQRIRIRPVADTQACTGGTQACVSRETVSPETLLTAASRVAK